MIDLGTGEEIVKRKGALSSTDLMPDRKQQQDQLGGRGQTRGEPDDTTSG